MAGALLAQELMFRSRRSAAIHRTPFVSSRHRRLVSAAIVVYLGYAFITGIPSQWHGPDVGVFPWRRWSMFMNPKPYHSELIVSVKSDSGDTRWMPMQYFFPRTTPWAIEVNRSLWLALRSSDVPLMRSLCQWIIVRYNDSTGAPWRAAELEIKKMFGSLPPHTDPPPLREERVITCREP